MKINTIGVGFASAMAFNLAISGKEVQIWSRKEKNKKDLFSNIQNIGKRIKFNPKKIIITTNISTSFENADICLLCIPAKKQMIFLN